MLIEGVLYEGGTMLLAGPSKARKTYTLIDLGISVSSGNDWMGFRTQQAPVLYLNLELPEHLMAERVKAICAKRGIEPPQNFMLLNLRGRTTTVNDLKRELAKLIVELGIKLVIIDPHYKVSSVSGLEENSNDDQGLLLAHLESFCVTVGAALVIAHHFAKGSAGEKNAIDRASGGGVFARWPDAFMALTPHEQDEAMVIELFLRAFAPVQPRVVRWNYPVWEEDKTLDPANLRKAGPKTKHPADDALKKLTDGMTNAEWERASGMTPTTYRRKRDKLLGDQVREDRGRYYRTP